MAVDLDGEGERAIGWLRDGRAITKRAGEWRAPGGAVAEGTIDGLRRHGLIAVEGGTVLLTPAGRGWRRAGRAGAGTRLLAERSEAGEGARGRAARSVTVNLAESPLGWLRARGHVDGRQFDAGEQLRGDWTRASLGACVTMRWDAAPSAGGRRGPGGAIDPTLAQIAAKRRFDAAVAAVGAGLSDVLWRVVCDGAGLEAAERALGWPARSGKVVLLIALDRLADHYGLPPAAKAEAAAIIR